MCFFSIIVVSYNAESCIEGTIRSITSQTETDYEIIVKDAVSTDRTLQFIPSSDKIRIYSMRDSGIYDGMNQAISFSNGKYLIFMNCGDSFHDCNVLKSFKESIIQDMNSPGVLYGNVFTIGNVIQQPKTITVESLSKRPLCHQSMVFSRQIFEICGSYDTSYRSMADYELCFKILYNGIQMKYVDIIACDYENNGTSAKKNNRHILESENNRILYQYVPSKIIKKNRIIRAITFVKVRSWIDSEDAPIFLRKRYKKIVEILKR